MRKTFRRGPVWALLLMLAGVLLLAGCGGTHTVIRTVTVAPPSLKGAPLLPAKKCHTMSCVLNTQPPPNVNLKPGGPPVVYGLDFAYGSISGPGAKALGKQFGASYLSTDSGKNWTTSNLASYHNAGLATVAVWETTATRALAGCAAGASDARSASAQLAALGAPAGQPFTMAIDFDASGPDVASYFHCALQAEPGRVNAYGGYRPLLYLHQHGDVGNLNWQTYAWSGGAWLPASVAPLEQYLNGSTFDNDRALTQNYGQWPGATLRINHHYGRYPTTRRKICSCAERSVARRYDRLRAQQRPNHHPHRAELRRLRTDARVLARRIDVVAHRSKHGYRVYHRLDRRDGLARRAHGAIVPRPKGH